MRKFYLLVIAIAMFGVVSAQLDSKVAVISQLDPSSDTIPLVKSFMDFIEGLDGYTSSWVAMNDIATTDFAANYDLVVMTENGGSSSMAAYSTANWPVPTVCLKTYMCYKGDYPLFEQALFYSSDSPDPFDSDIGTLKVLDNSDILSCWNVNDEVVWADNYNTSEEAQIESNTQSGGAHVQGVDPGSSTTSAEVAANSTALASSLYLDNDAFAPLKNFMWKIDANAYCPDIVIWGIHWGFIEGTTDDFWTILGNSIRWIDGAEPDCGGSGTEDILITQISVFPNPVIDNLSIKSAQLINNIRLLDVTGKTINVVENILDTQYTLGTSNLNNGIYFVQVETVNGLEATYKVIK